nr:MAG TPA: hypothetical protein [Caudoviricetes sp.]
MKTIPKLVTPDDFPDWSQAFVGEESYPLEPRFRGPLLTAACWSAWYASTGDAPSANPKDIARLAARALADINGVPAERIISGARGAALLVLSRGATGWLNALVTKDLYNNLKLCQAADATEHAQAEAWLRGLVLAHAVGAAEAQK